MGRQIWVVVGGGDKGGIVVREGVETSSPLAPVRLSTSAFIKQLELQGDRLHFAKVHGEGPDTGWVSLKLTDGRPLVQRADELWIVIGGGDKGGIVVREGLDQSSAMLPERLATGSVVRQLATVGMRIEYERLTGTGPDKGCVSIRLDSGKELLSKVPEQSDDWEDRFGPPLEILMTNDDKGFSYEGLPPWVAKFAAIAKLRREGKPYLPTLEPDPPFVAMAKPLTAFKKLAPKILKEMLVQNLPGCMYGLPFPRTAEQIASGEFGAEWLTKAFHAAGTLPEDNRVSKVTRAKGLDFSGFNKEGGAAMKCFIDVEYEKPDPNLHKNLFAKYTFDILNAPAGQMTIGSDDGPECWVTATCAHRFPFHSPKYYYADVCRETTAYIIITECIPYGKSQSGKDELGPFDILPGCGKCQDWKLEDPLSVYNALFRAMGMMGAWDKLGRFDSFFGPSPVYDEWGYLSGGPRPPQTNATLQATKTMVGKRCDMAIDLFQNWCKKLAPKWLQDDVTLQKIKAELVEMSPYFTDMSGYYQSNNSKWLAANHANLQADNAYFWKDEYGNMDVGVLDWGGFSRSPFAVRFLGCLSGADAEFLVENIIPICTCYADEYYRCGGPKVTGEEISKRFHLAFITSLYDQVSYVERHTFKESTKEEMSQWTMFDPEFQNRFFTRCGTLPCMNAWGYYIKRGDFKKMFDDWKAGEGKPYLTVYS